MYKLKLLIVSIIFLSISCKKENNGQRTVAKYEEDPSIIQDQYGRQLILHGLNTSSSAKSEPQRNPWIAESDVDREAKEFGFNFVRYLIFWDNIEPEKDVFSEAYLDRIQERVEWYTNRKMYVMLDMHQDLYALKFGGDGAPEWAIRPNGKEPIDLGAETPWWLKNIDPAVVNSWINFWSYTNHKDLQDHYALAWQKVAERFKDNPYVIGYDLMNEPWGGDLLKVFITGEFERKQLYDFYNRLIPKIRAIDQNKYLFFEPTPAPVTFGAPSNLPAIIDTRTPSKLVYAPHCYPYDTHEGLGYSASSKKNLIDWERERKKDVTQKNNNIPLVTGEFGLSPNNAEFDVYLTDFMNMSDRNQWHWTYWSNDRGGWSPLNDDGTETAILQYLVRTYPKAIAGKIISLNFDNSTKVFTMTYSSNPTINKPTEIFVPNRFYPSGYNVQVNGTDKYIITKDEVTQTINIDVNEIIATEVTITIEKK
jgi:endoglycosylceramidase